MDSKIVTIATFVFVLGVTAVVSSPPTVTIRRCEGHFCFDNKNHKSVCSDQDIICCRGPGEEEWTVQYPDRPGLECCYGSGELYNKAEEICVNGTKRVKNFQNEFECGITATYNSDTQDCCRKNETYGRVYAKGGQCCNDTYLTDPNTACCEGIVYNRSEQTCCENETLERHTLRDISYGECCGSLAFDPATDKCGDNGVEAKSDSEMEQCNGINFNPKMYLCCNEILFTLANHLCYQGRQVAVKSSPNHNQVCEVENNVLVTFFNGSDSKYRKVCIQGKKIKQLSPGEAVCLKAPNGVYNTTADLCCLGSKYYEGGKLSGLKCCDGSTVAFNPKRQTCCRDKIHNSRSEEEGGSCCGKKVFDSRTHYCDQYRDIKARCNLSNSQVEELKVSFHKGGLSVYVGTVQSGPKESRKGRSWTIKDVEELASSKKKKGRKIMLSKVENTVTVKAKGTCPSNLVAGDRYIFLSSKPLKKHSLKLKVKDISKNKKNTDAIVPLNDVQILGTWLQILFSSTKNS